MSCAVTSAMSHSLRRTQSSSLENVGDDDPCEQQIECFMGVFLNPTKAFPRKMFS